MSTLDTTVSMVQKCTEDELQVVQQVIRQFFLNRKPHTTTKNNFLRNYKFPESSTKAARAKRLVKLDDILFYIMQHWATKLLPPAF